MTKQRLATITRLNEVCDLLQLPAGRGRQTALAKLFKWKQQTVNLWFTGETEPKLEAARAMAIKAKVQVDWLLTGREPKFLEKQHLRPAIAALVKAAEPLPDYQVQQLTKIVPAIAEPENGGPDGRDEGDEAPRQKKRPM
jgi:hypothetical protein